MIARQTRVVDEELASIKVGGNCTHEVFALKYASCGAVSKPLPVGMTGAVQINNNDDCHYVEYFRSRDELNEFIAKLNEAADSAWGKSRGK